MNIDHFSRGAPRSIAGARCGAGLAIIQPPGKPCTLIYGSQDEGPIEVFQKPGSRGQMLV